MQCCAFMGTIIPLETLARSTTSSTKLWTERNWTLPFILITLFVNALHVLTLARHIEWDGISYLDIAWAYARGDWSHAINAYWGPLFSWILAAVLRVSSIDRFRELIVLHAVNFVAFAFAIVAFIILVREIQRWQNQRAIAEGTEPLSAGQFSVACYSMFLYASRFLLSPFIDQPDIILEALVILDTALLVRIARGDSRLRTFAVLGVALGASYLTKAVMFPLAFVFLFSAFLVSGAGWRAIRRTLLAALVFSLLAVPWIALLSHKQGRLTYGTVGGIAYFTFSHRLTSAQLRMGGPPGNGQLHPIQIALSSPPVLLFPSTQGTLPPWYDPSFYFAGVTNHVSLRSQALILEDSFRSCAQLLSEQKAPLAVLFVLLLFCGLRRYSREFLKRWPIWLPSAVALIAYGFVEFLDRLVVPFLVIFWVVLLSAVYVPRVPEARRIISCGIAVMILLFCLPVLSAPVGDIRVLRIPAEQRDSDCGPQWKVARGLREMGLMEGDHVAVIGEDNQSHTECWAEFDGLSIVGEIPSEGADSYWEAPADLQVRILRLFALASAKVAVTYAMPPSVNTAGWQRVSETSYYVRFLADRQPANLSTGVRD